MLVSKYLGVSVCCKILTWMSKVHIYTHFGFKYNVHNSQFLDINFWNDTIATAEIIPELSCNIYMLKKIAIVEIDVSDEECQYGKRNVFQREWGGTEKGCYWFRTVNGTFVETYTDF